MRNWLRNFLGFTKLQFQIAVLEERFNRLENHTRTGKRVILYGELERARKRRYKKRV